MPKYNGSATATSIGVRRASSVFGASLAVMLAACSQQPTRTSSMPPPAPAAPEAAVSLPVSQPATTPVRVREDAPLRYVVKKGDTLWDIAAYFLQEPWQWPEIWYVNDEIANPHLIYPGDVLTLIWRDGRPVVMRELPTDRMGPVVREVPLEDPIPTIPIDRIRDFLKGPYVVDEEVLDRAPYILAFGESHLIEGEGSTVYVRRLPEQILDAYQAVRRGDKYIDPVTGRFLGWEAVPVADVQMEAAGDPGTGLIARSYREARAGDLLVKPPQQSFNANFYPHAPKTSVDAYIISVFDGVSQIGQYDIVALNRGTDDGMEPGDVLDVYQAGRKARDPYTGRQVLLPERYAGNLMVFKVESKVSYALIMKATLQIHLLDHVREPGLN